MRLATEPGIDPPRDPGRLADLPGLPDTASWQMRQAARGHEAVLQPQPTADLVRSGAMEGKSLAVVLARGRIAIGVVSLLAPGPVARTMTGRAGSGGGASLFASMVGARDLGLGLGLLTALGRGAPVRGWLEASALVDGIDVAACLLARRHIRTSVLPGAVGLAAAGALLSARLARQLDPAPSPVSAGPGR